MLAARIETTVQADGELHLTRLPCRTGERVERLLILENGGILPRSNRNGKKPGDGFLELARASQFTGLHLPLAELQERR